MNNWISPDDALRNAYGENPLLEAIGPYLDTNELASKLRQNPLTRIDWRNVRPEQREALLPLIEDHFVPTPIALDIAKAFQSLIRQHYIHRNPMLPRTRSQVGTLSTFKGKKIQDVPWFNGGARAMALRGITGTGKSVAVERTLSLFDPIVVHGENSAAGWTQLKQLVYLRVQMSGDASRGGFLTQILAQIDAALGTNYYEQYAAKTAWTVEKLMVVVGIILARHYCGALVIEELQARNFSDDNNRNALVLFFLRLLNFGIPIVLIGNPLGFRAFDYFSQDVRRLYSAGCFDLWPSDAIDDAGWDERFLPGLAKFHVLDRPFQWTPKLKERAKYESGGVPSFMAALWAACQRNALASRNHVIDEESLVVAAANDPTLVPQHRLIHALRNQDVDALSACEDVPYDDFAKRWGVQYPASTNEGASEPAQCPSPAAPTNAISVGQPTFVRVEAAHKAKSTKQKKAASKSVPSHAAGDLRSKETYAALEEGFAALQRGTSNGDGR